MKVLTVDIGNTCIKGSVFEERKLLESVLLEERNADELLPLIRKYEPDGAISCCVGGNADRFVNELESISGLKVMQFNHASKLPIEVEYDTFQTLGLDRIAAAVGAATELNNSLVVDAGTAVTFDLVSDKKFLGGNISPGLRLRLRSLNHYTSRLPLVNPNGETPRFGCSTSTAIRSGVVNGIVAEICSTYHDADRMYPGITLILTGGDADFLSPMLKQRGLDPQVDHSLVGHGLEQIYKMNIR